MRDFFVIKGCNKILHLNRRRLSLLVW